MSSSDPIGGQPFARSNRAEGARLGTTFAALSHLSDDGQAVQVLREKKRRLQKELRDCQDIGAKLQSE